MEIDTESTFTRNCDYCSSHFLTYNNSGRRYCSKDCQIRGGLRNSKEIFKSSACKFCRNEFDHYGAKAYCSIDCVNKDNILNKIKTDDIVFNQLVESILLSCSIVVNKGWGIEVHIVNHEKYCLKYLIFLKDKKFSYHYHNLKQELWHCLYGKFNCRLLNNINSSEFIFDRGDKIEILPSIKHQLKAIENSIIVEVSTIDYIEDSIRIEKGD